MGTPHWSCRQEGQRCHPNPWRHSRMPPAAGCNPCCSLSPEICSQTCMQSLQMTYPILHTQKPAICAPQRPWTSHALKPSFTSEKTLLSFEILSSLLLAPSLLLFLPNWRNNILQSLVSTLLQADDEWDFILLLSNI